MKRIIAENGKSCYHIVTSQFADEGELFAASQLKEYIYKSANAVIPYFSDRCEKRGAEIRIGRNVREHIENVSMLCDEGFRVFTDGEDIVITGKTPRGVIYGVFRFLELTINYRCFTKNLENYSCSDVIAVDEIDLYENPSFEYRDVYFRGAFDCDFAVKNRLNSSLALIPQEKGGKLKFYNFHHSFYDILPPDIYFDEHPEYFSEVDGVRLRNRGQLCLTNENAISEAVRRVKEWIKARPDCKVFSVAQNDWQNYCTCSKCREMDDREGSHSGTVIYFVNRIAQEIEKEYPDVLIHTFAYQYSKRAPKYIKPRNNVIVRLCNIECTWDESIYSQFVHKPDSASAEFVRNIADWSHICKHLYIWDYACNFSFYILPFPNYYVLSENMKYYKKSKVAGVLQQGNFSYGDASGLADLETYIAAKLLWNADADVKILIDEFTNGCYGSAAKYMREYIDLLCNTVKGHHLRLYYSPDAEFITDNLVEQAEVLFGKALRAVDSEEIRNRIKKEYLSVRFMRISRLPLDFVGRQVLIDTLYDDIKKNRITEIQERRNIEISFKNLSNSRYCTEKDGNYSLYYIMK